jgi:hypothetical protein
MAGGEEKYRKGSRWMQKRKHVPATRIKSFQPAEGKHFPEKTSRQKW